MPSVYTAQSLIESNIHANAQPTYVRMTHARLLCVHEKDGMRATVSSLAAASYMDSRYWSVPKTNGKYTTDTASIHISCKDRMNSPRRCFRSGFGETFVFVAM